MSMYCEVVCAAARKLDSVAHADYDPWRGSFLIETRHEYDDGRPIVLHVGDDDGVADGLLDYGEAFKPPGYTGMDDIDSAYFGPTNVALLRDAAAACGVAISGEDDPRLTLQLMHPIEKERDVAGALAGMIEACKVVGRLVYQAHRTT